MADITLKRHDTWPPIKATLMQESGAAPIDLTAAETIKIFLKTGSTLIEGVCSVTAAKEGKVEYTWGASDTALAGTYEVEFEIQWTPTHIQSVPSGSYGALAILADLPNA